MVLPAGLVADIIFKNRGPMEAANDELSHRADFVRTDWCAKHWSAASRRPRMDGSFGRPNVLEALAKQLQEI